jgi:predicted MFS family arabinose efflux permease
VLFGAGAVLPFVVNGTVTVFAVLLVLAIAPAVLRLAAQLPGVEQASPSGISGGLGWLLRDRTVRSLVLVVTLVALADSAWFGIFVLYTREILGLEPAGFGALLALGIGGGLLGSLLADRAVAGRRHARAVAVSAAAARIIRALLLVLPQRIPGPQDSWWS